MSLLRYQSWSLPIQKNVVDVERTENIISQDQCTTIRQFNWLVIDDCGNTLTAQQTLTLTDNEIPFVQQLPDTMVTECGMEDFLAPPFASDDCDTNVGLSMNQLRTDIDPCTYSCLLYTSPSPRDLSTSRMPSSA